jgi:glycosyltransferase involved in cell wall biosynthesis
MILGIDACNIRQGGGVTHLLEIIKEFNPDRHGFNKIIIWSSKQTLDKIPDRICIEKINNRFIEKNFISTFIFQLFYLRIELKSKSCDIVLVPGGTFLSSFTPYVAISQNLLPFELKEAFRYNSFFKKLKFILLRIAQSYTFKNATGLIFLTQYAKNIISSQIKIPSNSIIIPHGINKNYLELPKPQLSSKEYIGPKKFNLLYVSILSPYKHQSNIVESVCRLNEKGYPIKLILIGPSELQSLRKFNNTISSFPNSNSCIDYLGAINHSELFQYYKDADAFIFASTCENLPIILIEAMSSGLPILCSNYGPMPEVLGDNGNMYFDPLNLENIQKKIVEFFEKKDVRENISNQSFNKSLKYSWSDIADYTYEYLLNTISKKRYEK